MAEQEKPKPKKNKPKKQPKKDAEEPMFEQSPSDAEDKCLLSPPPSAGAEPLPEASGSGECSTSATAEITGFFQKISPFKKKDPQKRKAQSSFTKAKEAFRRTFRKSDSSIRTTDPEFDEKRTRKISDPTLLQTKDKPKPEIEARKSLFRSSKASTSKETKKTKEPKKGFFEHLSGSASKKTAADSKIKDEAKAGPSVQKKKLSLKTSNQSSIGGVSLGFFNEWLESSESSGVPTESTSADTQILQSTVFSTESTSVDTQNVRSGSVSPDNATKRSSIKRPRTKDTDEESGISDS